MSSKFLIPNQAADYVSLARSQTGKLFKKQILRRGPLRHPKTGEIIDVSDSVISSMIANFSAKVCDIVPFPLANSNNEHDDAPERNAGEVIGLEDDGKSLYAIIDVRKPSIIQEIGSTILGASAYLHMNYTDTRTGKSAGPTLLHVCATNRPYELDLEGYREIVAATATDISDEDTVLLSYPAKEASMTLDDLLVELSDKHGIDVKALQARVAEADQTTAALTAQLSSAGSVKLSNTGGITADDMVQAVGQLAKESIELTASVKELRTAAARTEVEGYVTEGRITPAQVDAYLELRMSNPTLFSAVVPAKSIVELSAPKGVTPDTKTPEVDLDAFAANLVSSL